jgi:hypothetical protein
MSEHDEVDLAVIGIIGTIVAAPVVLPLLAAAASAVAVGAASYGAVKVADAIVESNRKSKQQRQWEAEQVRRRNEWEQREATRQQRSEEREQRQREWEAQQSERQRVWEEQQRIAEESRLNRMRKNASRFASQHSNKIADLESQGLAQFLPQEFSEVHQQLQQIDSLLQSNPAA